MVYDKEWSKNDETGFSALTVHWLKERKSEREQSVHHRLHLVLSGTSIMRELHESAMSSAMNIMGSDLKCRPHLNENTLGRNVQLRYIRSALYQG